MQSESRVVIVTGGAYGIGRGIVRHFCARGDRVVIADVNAQRGTALESELACDGGQVRFIRTDVTSADSVNQLMADTVTAWGRIDVLCNNAGIERPAHVADYKDADWEATMSTNLRGAFYTTRAAIPHLRVTRGSIANIASIHASVTTAEMSVYAATKGALLAFTRGTALECAPYGIRINAVCPGVIDTGLMEAYLKTQADPQAAVEFYKKHVPLGRIGQPEDIAPLVWFLASPEASYITGASILVDGGALAQSPIP
jgi:NAD(P)-dependent dehydrogenase (short-subunit alcohol dehydrogenase family)